MNNLMSARRGQYFSEGTAYRKIGSVHEKSVNKGVILYEVLRVHDGCCLFLEDHIQRLQESIVLSGNAFAITLPELRGILNGLVEHNGLRNGNIRISVHFPAGEPPGLYTYFIPHYYPAPYLYKKGVSTDLSPAVRLNPNVKQQFPDIRDHLSDFIITGNLYEALLVNGQTWVTEGSRSNVFFIQGDSVYTPPGGEVLKGITRKKVIELCNKLNLRLLEKPVSTEELSLMDAAFLTGTSPKVIPIRKIGNLIYRVSHPIVHSLMKAYDDLIAEYIQLHRFSG